MLETLRALTARGRAFLAGGLTALVCAVVLGQDPLLQVGVLVTALPLLSVCLVALSRPRLTLARHVTPTVVPAGAAVRVELVLRNNGRFPTGILMLQEQLPMALGSSPRFVLTGMGPGRQRHAGYFLEPSRRGSYQVGPMTVSVTDPFGLVALGRVFPGYEDLVVTPPTVSLPPIPLAGDRNGSGDNRPREFAVGSAEDVTVREYRHGDDLRRVHWPSSARSGELMVRREEQPWQARATVYLDNRLVAHRGEGALSSLEYAVSAAASVSLHLIRRGYTVRLVTSAGDRSATGWHVRDASADVGPLLEQLAVVGTYPRPTPETTWLAEGERGGLVIGVFGELGSRDVPFLSRLAFLSTRAMALVLDVGQWQSRGTGQLGDGVATARSRGWRAVGVGPEDPVERAWQHLGSSAAERRPERAGR